MGCWGHHDPNSAHNAMHPAAWAVWADQTAPASTLSLDTVMPGPGFGGDDAGLERMKVGLSHNIDKLAKKSVKFHCKMKIVDDLWIRAVLLAAELTAETAHKSVKSFGHLLL